MFGFGVGETAAAIAAVIQGLKSLNEGLNAVKESAASAGQITGLVSKYADLEEKIRDVEQRRAGVLTVDCLLYTSPSPRDGLLSRMPSSA